MALAREPLTIVIAGPPVPAPKGHYAHAVWSGDLLWVSGIVGSDKPGLDAGQQARVALGILHEAGTSLDRVVTTTAYTTDPGIWAGVNDAYLETVGAHRPARTIVPGALFDADCVIEIHAVATR